jgi:hypothetical protein
VRTPKKQMMKIRIIILILTVFSLSAFKGQKCGCLPPSPEQTTSRGQQNVIIKHGKVVQSLRGTVMGVYQRPIEGVLVEVYDKPEGLLMDWQEQKVRSANQRRLAACVTGADGAFCFSRIPPGKYELRCSKPIEWNVTSVYVSLAPQARHSTNSKIVVPLRFSQ